MAIESRYFGGCVLTGEDAKAFRQQFLGGDFKCGHPKSVENTLKNGRWTRCRICHTQREIKRTKEKWATNLEFRERSQTNRRLRSQSKPIVEGEEKL